MTETGTVRARWPGGAELRLMSALWALELAALVTLQALYKRNGRALAQFVSAATGRIFVLAVVGGIAAAILAARYAHRLRATHRRADAVIFANVLSLVLVFCVAEIITRSFTVRSRTGPVFAGLPLLPRDWSVIAARNRALLAAQAAEGSYLTYDSTLGWTVAPNERSGEYNAAHMREYMAAHQAEFGAPASGAAASDSAARGDIYFSSREGIRSDRVGVSFADARPRRRIALVGDSYTFALEVPYEQSWGYQLEKTIGDDTQVLNFGVDGYGLDQAYLRYVRDVRAWHPQIVILSIIDDDLRRSICVYGFLCYPDFDMPFPKPRFLLRGNHLTLVNVPLPAPSWIFAQRSAAGLPFVEDDASYDPNEWQQHWYFRSYAIRYLLSRFPRRARPGPTVDDAAMRALNTELFRSFVRTARDDGATPVIVYFPSRTFFLPEASRPTSVSKEVLDSAKLPYLDMTECVTHVDATQRFMNLHYSAATNAAVARCIARGALSIAR